MSFLFLVLRRDRGVFSDLGKQIAAHQSTGFERSETRDHGEIQSTPMSVSFEFASPCLCFFADTSAPRHLFRDDPGHEQDSGP